jgi:hypothetical protein
VVKNAGAVDHIESVFREVEFVRVPQSEVRFRLGLRGEVDSFLQVGFRDVDAGKGARLDAEGFYPRLPADRADFKRPASCLPEYAVPAPARIRWPE